MSTSAWSVALAALFFLLPGCGDSSLAPGLQAEQANRCHSDDDCSGVVPSCEPGDFGEFECDYAGRCEEELAVCVDPDLVDFALILQVTDPESAAISDHRLVASQVNGAAPSELRLPEPLVVRGMVDDEREGTAPTPISSRLAFRRLSDLPGLSNDVVYVDSEPESTFEGDDAPFNFRVRLVPGSYEIEVEPTSEPPGQGPEPNYYPLRLVQAISAEDGEAPLLLRYESESRYIFGSVTSFDGEPLGGVRVFAHDTETARRISSVALTECPSDDEERCGRFQLALPPDTETFRLRIQGGDSSPFLPQVDRGGYSFEQRDANGDGIVSREELGEVRFPAFAEPVVVQAVVYGEDRTGVRSPVAGAVVTFFSDQIGDPLSPVGVFEARATTDVTGAVSGDGGLGLAEGTGIRLLPVKYVVTITPPAGSGYASAETELVVLGGEEVQEVTLAVGHLQLIRGRVSTVTGVALPEVRVEARGDHGRSFSSVNEQGGEFLLEVDPGRYDLTFVTPVGSFLPWVLSPGISAFNDVDLPVPVFFGSAVSGVVHRGEDEAPVLGASIEAFVERSAEEGDTVLVPVGRASTAEDGTFSLVVGRLVE